MSMDEQPQGPRLIRPYTVTGGRARPRRVDLEVEVLVSTAVLADELAGLSFERRQIATLCEMPQSVAEISALLKVPLGVARVLVGDMAEEGLVRVQQGMQMGDRPDPTLLERVLDGLRGL